MSKIPTVAMKMTPLPHSIGLDQSLDTAKEMMRKYGIRHLPVQKGGRLVGILTDRDVQFALSMEEELSVEDSYVPEPYTVAPGMLLDEVAERMGRDRIGCALVVEGEKLVGIFTAVDACNVLAETLRARG
jgi:acetoin utilization protein AcuB